nr:amidohydrolase family protein [Phytoactinopolyspora limicola]
MAVQIADGPIVQVRPWANGRGVGVDVVDLSSATLVPGFVDAHVHLIFGNGKDHLSTRAAVENATRDELVEQAASRALECLRGGVTTVRDCGDREFVSLRVRDDIAAGRRRGARVLAAGPPITVPGGHLSWCGGAVASLTEMRTAVMGLLANKVDLVKVMASGGNMTRESSPWAPQFGEAELRELVALAHTQGLRVAAHAHSTEAIRHVVSAGVDTIEHCTWRSADGRLSVDARVVEQIVRRGPFVVLTMAGIQRGLLPNCAPDSALRKAALISSDTGDLREDFAWARSMRAAGARLVVASDAGVRLTSFDGLSQSIRCGMVALGLAVSEAISLVTLRAAEAPGVEDSVGSIEEGKVADFVVLDGVVDASSDSLGSVRQVWQAGRLVVNDGQLVKSDDWL